MWALKSFKELSTTELYDILYARIQTFVVDQQRVYQEIDDIDKRALHLMDYEDGKLVAYARIFTEKEHVTFGRVLTVPSVRGKGYGRLLLQHIMADLNDRFSKMPIEIEAQVQVQGLYRKFGFEPQGDVFLFNSTPHVLMCHDAMQSIHAVQSAGHLDRE